LICQIIFLRQTVHIKQVGDPLKSTKFWLGFFAIILLCSVLAAIWISWQLPDGTIANVYQAGVCIYSIDLSQVEEPYSISVSGEIENTITVEQGRICVSSATCPDQVCVHQGWISDRVIPVVCLPNALVIQIENTPGMDIDGLSR